MLCIHQTSLSIFSSDQSNVTKKCKKVQSIHNVDYQNLPGVAEVTRFTPAHVKILEIFELVKLVEARVARRIQSVNSNLVKHARKIWRVYLSIRFFL